MSAYRSRNIVRIALGIASLLALLAAAFLLPPEARTGWPGWAEIVLTLALTIFMVNFAIPLPVGEGSLVHLAGLTAVLIYDPTWAIAVVALGVLLGDTVRSLWPRGPSYRDVPWGERLGLLGLDIAQQVFGLLAALLGYLAFGGRLPFSEFSAANSIGLLGYVLGFFLGFNALLFIDIRLRRDTLIRNIRLNRGGHVILELLPVPFAVYGALLHSTLGFFLYTSLAGLIAIITVVFYSFGWARVNAEKRLHELTRINKVSQAMRFSLDLDSLLETIYLQVASLLGVQNFYIALHDLETDTIYFPIAIKEGERTHWPARPFAKRLTDYVIRTSAPLLVPYDVPATIQRLGLEPGDNQPVAWMGVPLLSSERAIGCLAVLSYTPGGKIPIEAATFLSTVAAQAGVAIENAQMFGQTRRRAAELSTLTEISTAMAASLDPERVLELVCSSVIRVFSAQKSAIFLLTEDRQTLVLARAKGLTEAFLSASRTLTMDNANRVKAVTTALPVVVPDVQTTRIPADIAELAQTEGFGSYAELPLQAQGEMIGLLAVYFAGSHRFRGAEIDLLKTFAAQAALAVANARLYARTDQALARRVEQLQALEAISRELSSTLDSERLFNVILDRAMEFTGAAVSSLHLLNAEKGVLAVVASRGYPPDFARFMAVTNHSISARVQQAGEARLVPDVREDPDYADATHNTLSQLSVPIRSEGRTLGVITLESPALAAFSEDDARFISQLTAQAAVAIDNARLYRQVQDRLREQSLLYDSSAAITSSLDLSITLHTVAQKIAEAMGAVACTISDLDPASGLVVRVAEFTTGATPPFMAAPYLLANYPARRRMLANRESFSVRLDASSAEPAEAELLRANGWQAMLALPLVAATHVLGLMEVFAD
ncbi:MAG: GAF domain-containing protein, partial [Chloroflexi bacterium]|nr:GAF domain-containing protein [Chloroflexota bacterium]